MARIHVKMTAPDVKVRPYKPRKAMGEPLNGQHSSSMARSAYRKFNPHAK